MPCRVFGCGAAMTDEEGIASRPLLSPTAPAGTTGTLDPVLLHGPRVSCSSQMSETSTYERSSAEMDVHPRSLRVRSKSARKISSARATPASPPAARP